VKPFLPLHHYEQTGFHVQGIRLKSKTSISPISLCLKLEQHFTRNEKKKGPKQKTIIRYAYNIIEENPQMIN